MFKRVCYNCDMSFKPFKNGVLVIETMKRERIEPYKLWLADVWQCPNCLAKIVVGFSGSGMTPFAEHWHDNFKEILTRLLKDKEDDEVVFDFERRYIPTQAKEFLSQLRNEYS